MEIREEEEEEEEIPQRVTVRLLVLPRESIESPNYARHQIPDHVVPQRPGVLSGNLLG